jgi:hypothetical protein
MRFIVDVGTRLATYAAVGTAGSLLVGYGLRTFLRATGGGYYCRDHAQHRTVGIVLTVLGWVVLLVGGISLYNRLSEQ